MIAHNEKMVAPCGINCTYCYVHHKKKKACTGCRQKDETKPVSCQKCKIKACINHKNIEFCYQCADFPCVLIKRLDKSYRTRYDESLIDNLQVIKEQGIDALLKSEQIRLKCPKCDGYLNIHDKICFKCGKQFK